MNKECKVCSADFEPEPGFYYGAMFVSYIGSAFILLFAALILVFAVGLPVGIALGVLLSVIVLTHAFLFKVSRSLWLHIFLKYDPAAAKQEKK